MMDECHLKADKAVAARGKKRVGVNVNPPSFHRHTYRAALMALRSLSTMRLPLQARASLSSVARHLHTTPLVLAERRPRFDSEDSEVTPEAEDLRNFEVSDAIKAFQTARAEEHESTAAGHLVMRQDRHVFKYLRLIENSLPELVGKFRRCSRVYQSLTGRSHSSSCSVPTPYIQNTPYCSFS